MTLREALMVRWESACTEDTPLPVTEILNSDIEVVRVPSFLDGWWWQGATLTRTDDGCTIRMDDGRFFSGTAEEVAKYFHEHADLWEYAHGHPDYHTT